MVIFSKRLIARVRSFLSNDRKGAAAVEYVLIAAIVGSAIVGGATALGGDISDELTKIGTAVDLYAG